MKVYAFRIPKKPGENIVVQLDKGPVFFDKLHQHEEIQISQIINGKGKLIVGDSVHSFENGDFFVIGSGIPHLFKSIEGEEDSHMISLFFSKDSFGSSFFENQEMYDLKSFFTHSESGFKLESKNNMVQGYMEDIVTMGNFSRFIHFLQLLKKVSSLHKIKLSNFVHPKEISNDQGERLRSVYDFVMRNFNQKIELEMISELVHMTPNAFCRFFKQRTNKTFFKFLIEVRVEHACQLLLHNHDLTVADIANLSGFNSISNFNRKFKEIKGMNPLMFTKQLN
ncbi:AraC family transcriptional regulator [Flagellimonas pacifica]|uniref:Transcriptional regulator, AraC family n=1 Tax=Flagellimonas pacifica TaxID=1247520 RepID=A0A285MT73_9FLAO|nr:AraC family transcriptional regulator [Allomuricauda parva]SNY99737.1 transcriptional regulator, AraC family [Allomuricauda parva]